MNSRERFLAACRGETLDRPPLWMMRQAGRYLPEYRALKQQHGFLKMVQTPELATEVTLQPIRRFGFDAAILFSDILVIPEAMGQPYRFRDEGGIAMDFALESAADIDRLETGAIRERLDYVPGALKLLRRELDGKTALLGFAGAPWTLATYMVEGGSSTNYRKVKQLLYEHPDLFEALMEKLTAAVSEYLVSQAEAGADAVQIFDSWGSACPGYAYEKASLQWIRRIVEAINGRIPVILYAKGLHHRIEDLTATGARVISVDWTADLRKTGEAIGGAVALQGNLDPVLLDTTPDIVRREAGRILDVMRGYAGGHIFNLGHGILPTARIENVEALVETVRGENTPSDAGS